MTFPCQTDPFNKYFWRTKNLPGQRWLEHSPNTRESRRLGQTLNQGLERKDDCAKAQGQEHTLSAAARGEEPSYWSVWEVSRPVKSTWG